MSVHDHTSAPPASEEDSPVQELSLKHIHALLRPISG